MSSRLTLRFFARRWPAGRASIMGWRASGCTASSKVALGRASRAASSWPLRTAATRRGEGAAVSSRRMVPNCLPNAASRGRNRPASTELVRPRRRRAGALSCRSDACAISSRSRMCSACGSRVRPAGVRATPCVSRSNKRVPSRSSSSLMARDRGGWVMCNCSAAWRKFRQRATAQNRVRAWVSMALIPERYHEIAHSLAGPARRRLAALTLEGDQHADNDASAIAA